MKLITRIDNEKKCAYCRDDWYYFQDNCYYINKNHLTWRDAKSFCNLNGANTINITSDLEFQYVKSLVNLYREISNDQNGLVWVNHID